VLLVKQDFLPSQEGPVLPVKEDLLHGAVGLASLVPQEMETQALSQALAFLVR